MTSLACWGTSRGYWDAKLQRMWVRGQHMRQNHQFGLLLYAYALGLCTTRAIGFSIVMWAMLRVGFAGIWKGWQLRGFSRKVCSKSSVHCAKRKDSPVEHHYRAFIVFDLLEAISCTRNQHTKEDNRRAQQLQL